LNKLLDHRVLVLNDCNLDFTGLCSCYRLVSELIPTFREPTYLCPPRSKNCF
jgi:hypothetical protein